MANYQEEAKALLGAIGGESNISAVSHCMTRMRFVLADERKADVKAIEDIACVKGTFTQAGQFQVIIGNDVPAFFQDFTAIAGIEGVSREAVKETARASQTWLQRMMSNLGEIFAPIIPALICGGLVLGFRNVIDSIAFFENGTKTLVEISQFWAGVDSFLWLIGEAVFWLLPVGIVWSVTKKMGTTQILGIVLGLTLVSSQLLNGFDVSTTPAGEIPKWDFGFAQVDMIGYQGQVIAAMMAGFVLVYLERFFRRICPEVISMIVVPVCSLVPAVFIAHMVVGPIGWTIGNAIGDLVYTGLTSNARFLFAGLFGFFYAPIVMTGLHHMTNAVDSQLVTTTGGTMLWPMIALSNIAQGSSVLAMSVLQKKNERARQVNVPALISCYLGVTEPALFGVNLKYGFPLVCGMIGSACAALISVGFGVQATSIGVGGLPGILSIFPRYYLIFLLAMAAAIVIPFALTFLVGSRKLSREQTIANQASGGVLKAFLSGRAIPLEEVPDEVFSRHIMGNGLAIRPADSTVVAPADGTVSAVIEDSRHACGMMLDNGLELLIHVGIDTVSMNGDGFELFVQTGDQVRCGDPLIRFDRERISAAGHSDITVLVVADEGNAKDLQYRSGMEVKAKETDIVSFS